MDKKFTEQMTAMSENMLNALTTLQKINDKTVQSLTQQQFNAAESFMSVGAKQMKAISQAKDVQEAFSNQVEMTAEFGKMMQEHVQRAVEILSQSKAELDALMEKNIVDMNAWIKKQV